MRTDGGNRPDHEAEYAWRDRLRPTMWSRIRGGPSNRPNAAVVDGVYYRHRARLHIPWWERFLAGIVATLLATIVGGGAFVLTQRHRTTPVALEDVIERFEARRAPASAATGSEDAGVSGRTDATMRDTTVANDNAADEASTAPVATADGSAQPAPYALPREGVYTYRTTGGESVSTFGASHEYPSETYATVRHLGGCRWEHRNEPIAEHVDTTIACAEPGRILMHSQERMVTFFGQTEGAKNTCAPPLVLHDVGDEPGAVATSVCSSDEGSADLKRTFVRVERLTIGGIGVRAVHVRLDATFKGMATGTSVDHTWFSAEDAMLLRWERKVDSDAKAFGTTVHYNEEATFILASLDPRS